MGSREQKISISFAQAYEKLVGDIEDVAAVVRESADNLAERAPDADRTQMYESAADELENISVPDLPSGDFDDVSYTIDDRKNISKAVQVSNLVAAAEALGELLVVEGGNHRLAGTGRRDDQVAVAIVALSFKFEPLQHALLMRVRRDVDVGEGDRAVTERATAVFVQGSTQILAVDRRVVGLEVLGLPVAGESHSHPVDHVPGIDRR